ncbi:hypothetical protein LG198_12035 [Methylobacillus arboreus]|uniref:hypothetical protein n=1 Tax=Methylobacillus arboreus TaxID=755170 RepID=UPI001E3FA7C5|nr:hypothetical protein [Methylobacillus arboreus]MCB5191458.1 hypothetical protein [Methylobacillus arboreus]
MKKKFNHRFTATQKNIFYLLLAVIAGLVVYKLIGPNPPLTDQAHHELETKAEELEKRLTEDLEQDSGTKAVPHNYSN